MLWYGRNLKLSECQTKAGNLELSLSLVDPRDMQNNICFHVYAQKSLLIGENGNVVSLTASDSATPAPVSFEFIELVPS